jgi:hypothetical protein
MMADTQERPEMVSANVRRKAKVGLMTEAQIRGVSVSKLLSDWIEFKLMELNYDLTEVPERIDGEQTLPLEG